MAEEVMLPKKDSDLIELALADIRKVEADERYKVDMGVWHEYDTPLAPKKCAVCLAGAVMAKTLKVDPTETVQFVQHALDLSGVRLTAPMGASGVSEAVRIGRLDSYRNGEDPLRQVSLPDVCPHDVDREQFHKDMAKVAQALREAGR